MELEKIRKLIQLMKENQIGEIDWESQGEHIRIKSESPGHPVVMHAPMAVAPAVPALAAPPPPATEQLAPAPPAADEEPDEDDGAVIINSPLVGTFYRAPALDKPAFVEEGDAINEQSVLCIIEAMKVMNEIKAETKGTIRRILVENGQTVEFGQPLFAIDPQE